MLRRTQFPSECQGPWRFWKGASGAKGGRSILGIENTKVEAFQQGEVPPVPFCLRCSGDPVSNTFSEGKK